MRTIAIEPIEGYVYVRIDDVLDFVCAEPDECITMLVTELRDGATVYVGTANEPARVCLNGGAFLHFGGES